MILGNLTMNAVDLTKYVSVAPTYWFDYYFDLLSRTAKEQPNNQAIGTKVESCKKQVETDIKKGPTVVNQYVTTFRTAVQTISPAFMTVVQEHCQKFDVPVKVEINVPAPPPDLPYPHYEPHYEADFATSDGDIFVFWPDDSDVPETLKTLMNRRIQRKRKSLRVTRTVTNKKKEKKVKVEMKTANMVKKVEMMRVPRKEKTVAKVRTRAPRPVRTAKRVPMVQRPLAEMWLRTQRTVAMKRGSKNP